VSADQRDARIFAVLFISIGGPLLLIGNLGALFDWWEQTSVASLVIPEFLWELSLGIYAAVWGFRRDAPILMQRSTMRPQSDAA
jgi:hypothetical protein